MTELKIADRKVAKKTKTNIKNISSKTLNTIIVLVTEVVLVALAVQGLLSVIHAEHSLQVGISVGFVTLLLIARYRTK
jgi:hypothetical protein